MPAPGQSPFDGNPNLSPPTTNGYRPGLPDFNDANLQDDASFPPDPRTMPTAALLNTWSQMLVSVGKAMDLAGFGVIPGSSPSFSFWWTAANLVTVNPFTIVRSGAGNYTVSWAAGLLPMTGLPKAYLNTVLGAHNYAIGVVCPSPTSCQITTVQDAALTDLGFSVSLF